MPQLAVLQEVFLVAGIHPKFLVVANIFGPHGAHHEGRDHAGFYTPVHVHLVCGSILFPSSGGNSLVAKLSSGEPGVPGSSLMVSTSPLTPKEGRKSTKQSQQ